MRKSLVATMMGFSLILAACGGATPAAPTTAPAASTAAPVATTAAEPTAASTTAAEPTAAPTTAAEPTAAPTTAAETTFRVGLVTDVGKINDGTFNQSAYEGLQLAEKELGVEIAFIETQAPADYDKNLQQFADQDFDMIIGVGFLMGDAIKAAAEKNPDIMYAIVDNAYDPAITNVRGIVFAEDEAGYLAGVLAGSMSKSGVIGVVGGVEIPPVQKFLIGYENGAKSVNPDIEVKRVYIASFTDRAGGAEAARSFIAEGADVIFGAGGQTGSGAIQAAAEDGVFVIGVDADEYVTTFKKGSTPGSDKIISSAIKRVDVSVAASIKDALEGKLEGGTAVYSAANDGVGLAPFNAAESAIPAEVKAKIDETIKGLADGTIKTNVTLP